MSENGAPILSVAQLSDVVTVCRELADGIVATNTTLEHRGLSADYGPGGVSGKPLFAPSTEILRRVRELAGPQYPLIGVGGIFTADDARAKFEAGADLVQAYTGFIYEGPGFVRRVVGDRS